MKSPLRKRLPRELKSEFGKYLVVFIMMAITIGFVSGFLVADGSMLRAYDDSFQKYNIEDGYFQTKKKLTPAQKEDIEKSDVKVYENFYIEQKLTNGSTIRFFKNRKEVDKVCLMNGKMPKKSGEIAVDRMYADNNELKVGDTVKSRKKTFRITGLVALSDYSALFQNNNDTMFDAVKFGVAIVTDKDFETLNQVKVQYNYAWIYDKKPATEKKEKKMAEDLMEDMVDVVTIESFVPQYQNQSIHFTGDDMGSDRAMIVMLLYIVMAILAFVFGITISNTIRKEAGVIGTLRASGYTRRRGERVCAPCPPKDGSVSFSPTRSTWRTRASQRRIPLHAGSNCCICLLFPAQSRRNSRTAPNSPLWRRAASCSITRISVPSPTTGCREWWRLPRRIIFP